MITVNSDEKIRTVNGFQVHIDQEFGEKFKNLILAEIPRLRPVFAHACRENFDRGNPHGQGQNPMYAGERFESNKQVLIRALSGIAQFYPDLEEHELSRLVEGVERDHILIWVWEALRDSACADHWYAYEKQWD